MTEIGGEIYGGEATRRLLAGEMRNFDRLGELMRR